MATKIGRSDLIQIVLREWLETNAYLPVRHIRRECVRPGFRDHTIG